MKISLSFLFFEIQKDSNPISQCLNLFGCITNSTNPFSLTHKSHLFSCLRKSLRGYPFINPRDWKIGHDPSHWNSITRYILHHGGIGNTTRLFELRPIPWGWIISARGTMFIVVAHLCQLIYAASYVARLSFHVAPGSHLLFELVPSLISWISIRRVVRLVAFLFS